MNISIRCPNCHILDAIKCVVNPNDSGDVVEYPDNCPFCRTEVDNDMIADVQYEAQQQMEEALHRTILGRYL